MPWDRKLRESREKYFRLAWRRKTRRSWSVEEKPTCTSVRRRPRFVQRPQAQQKTVLHSLSARKRQQQQQQQRELRRGIKQERTAAGAIAAVSAGVSERVMSMIVIPCVAPMRRGGKHLRPWPCAPYCLASKCFLLFATSVDCLWTSALPRRRSVLVGIALALGLWLALRPARGGCHDGLGKYER